MSHTPGPWAVSSTVLVCDAEARVIANCTPFDVDVLAIPMQQVPFNTRLIAAAPDLLAALRDIVQAEWTTVSLQGIAPQHRQRLERARAAIAEATGQS